MLWYNKININNTEHFYIMTKQSTYWTMFLAKNTNFIKTIFITSINVFMIGLFLQFISQLQPVSDTQTATGIITIIVMFYLFLKPFIQLVKLLWDWSNTTQYEKSTTVKNMIIAFLYYLVFGTTFYFTDLSHTPFSTLYNIISFWGVGLIIIWGVFKILQEYVKMKLHPISEITIPYHQVSTFKDTLNYINAQLPDNLKDVIYAGNFYVIDNGCDYRRIYVTWVSKHTVFFIHQTLDFCYWFADTPQIDAMTNYMMDVGDNLLSNDTTPHKPITYFEDYDFNIITKIHQKIKNKKNID